MVGIEYRAGSERIWPSTPSGLALGRYVGVGTLVQSTWSWSKYTCSIDVGLARLMMHYLSNPILLKLGDSCLRTLIDYH